MANNVMNIDKQIEAITKDLPSNDYLLGRGLMQPFSPANSGSRKLKYRQVIRRRIAKTIS